MTEIEILVMGKKLRNERELSHQLLALPFPFRPFRCFSNSPYLVCGEWKKNRMPMIFARARPRPLCSANEITVPSYEKVVYRMVVVPGSKFKSTKVSCQLVETRTPRQSTVVLRLKSTSRALLDS